VHPNGLTTRSGCDKRCPLRGVLRRVLLRKVLGSEHFLSETARPGLPSGAGLRAERATARRLHVGAWREPGRGASGTVANVLSRELRLRVLAALVDGNSIRATSRMTGVHQDTIGRFAVKVGEGCQRLHDRIARDLTCTIIEVDEWTPRRGDRATSGPRKAQARRHLAARREEAALARCAARSSLSWRSLPRCR
jgi:hypothetical protein